MMREGFAAFAELAYHSEHALQAIHSIPHPWRVKTGPVDREINYQIEQSILHKPLLYVSVLRQESRDESRKWLLLIVQRSLFLVWNIMVCIQPNVA